MNAVKSSNNVFALCVSLLISLMCPAAVFAVHHNNYYPVVHHGHAGNKSDSNTLRLVHAVRKPIITTIITITFLLNHNNNNNNILFHQQRCASVAVYKYIILICENSFWNRLQVFRHGQRTPADTYPLDPYINSSWEPFGWGQLTNASKYYYYLWKVF